MARKSSSDSIISVEEAQEDPDMADTVESFQCFKENSAFSVCPNMAKGKFINLMN